MHKTSYDRNVYNRLSYHYLLIGFGSEDKIEEAARYLSKRINDLDKKSRIMHITVIPFNKGLIT